MISCTGFATTSITVFPCTKPITVHLFFGDGTGVDRNFTGDGTASISSTGSLNITMMATGGGIKFGVGIP